jgi:membrane-anchored glycerophosphoryl diester phosphodiesterase (GDPDase)
VNWHRGLLLGEAGGTAAAFRFDRSFWRYVGVALRFFLVYAALIIPLAVVFGVRAAINAPEPSPSVDTALNYALMLAVLPFSARCLLAFPMAAIGAKPPLLRGSWRMMRGNTWRLAGALFVVEIFGYVLNYLVDAAARFLAGLMGMETSVDIITWPINTAIVLLNVALGASLASYAYAVLTNHPLGREVTG